MAVLLQDTFVGSAGDMDGRTPDTTFATLNWAPMAMTAHIVFAAHDRDHPATQSPFVIGELGFGSVGAARPGEREAPQKVRRGLAGVVAAVRAEPALRAIEFEVLGSGEELEALATAAGRPARQRTTTYGEVASERVQHFAFMSAVGADPSAAASGSGAAGMPRYARVKGEAEEAVAEIHLFSDGAVPRYGTCVILVPMAWSRRSAHTCAPEPAPALPYCSSARRVQRIARVLGFAMARPRV